MCALVRFYYTLCNKCPLLEFAIIDLFIAALTNAVVLGRSG